MILTCKGIKTSSYYLPPFTLKKGERVVIYLGSGTHVQGLRSKLVGVFTGAKKIDEVTINEPVAYAEYTLTVPAHKRFFLPQTIAWYIKRRAGKDIEIAEKIYERELVKEGTKIKSLRGRSRRMLSIFTAFSRSRNVVFDLGGLGPQDAREIYDEVKLLVAKGGSAILLDNYEDMKNDCTYFIPIEWDEKMVVGSK